MATFRMAAFQKLQGPPFMPQLPALPEIREANMPAVHRGFEMEFSRFQGRGGGKRGLVQQWIVQGIEQQGRHPDFCQMRQGRGPGPVVFGSGEAVERGGDVFVEIADGADSGQAGGIDRSGKLPGFGSSFGEEGFEEAVEVETVAAALVEGPGA